MWNNYFGGRPRRDIPRRNYNEESSEEEESPLQSPARPPVSRAGSPQPLAVPTLCDNVDEDLHSVSQTLKNIGHTPLFRPTVVKEEEVVEGFIQGAGEVSVKAENMPDEQPIVATTPRWTAETPRACGAPRPR